MEKIRDLGIWLPRPHYNALHPKVPNRYIGHPHPQGPCSLILHSKEIVDYSLSINYLLGAMLRTLHRASSLVGERRTQGIPT